MRHSVDLRKLERRVASMEKGRQSFLETWRDLTENFLVHRGRYDLGDVNQGKRRDNKIFNNAPILALRVLTAGLMSGITSPAREWFRLSSGDVVLDKDPEVQQWLFTCTQIMYRVFSISNLYNSLQTAYGELGNFGTCAMGVFEDDETFLRFETQTAGQYALGEGKRELPDAFSVRRKKTVASIVKDYGLENCPEIVRNLWKNGGENDMVEVIYLVEPNDDRNDESPFAWDLPYRAVTWVAGASKADGALRVSGYRTFPFLTPRWELSPGDLYGTNSPGLTALGDAKGLQVAERDILVATDRLADPSFIASSSLRRLLGDAAPEPGRTYYSENPNEELKPLMPNYNPSLQHMENSVARAEFRIREAFYVDLFRAMDAIGERSGVTAREVIERHEEKLLQIGPVLERVHNELLDPLISRSFEILQSQGVFPEAPEEMLGQELQVEYVSALAQAQRMVGLRNIERMVGFAGQLAQFDPSVIPYLNGPAMLREYGKISGADPELLRPEEEVQAILDAQREEAQRREMAESGAQSAKDLAQAAKLASETEVGGADGSMLSRAMQAAGVGV